MAVLTPEIVMRLVFVFWLPAQVGHFAGFLYANRDDIILEPKIFFIGDIIGWFIMWLGSWLLVHFSCEEWKIWVFYLVYFVFISTILSDIFMHQETSGLPKIKAFLTETLKESILFPWFVGGIMGGICLIIWPV